MTTPEILSVDFQRDTRNWLQAMAQKHNFRWLLAHADDGVIWGRLDDRLLLSSDVDPQVSPLLHATTLQQVRLFDENGELFIWKDDLGWHSRLWMDGDILPDNRPPDVQYDERQALWGDQAEPLKNDFTRLTERRQSGMTHCPPLLIEQNALDSGQRLMLHVRNYVRFDETSGEARIAFSRLADLSLEEEAC